MRLTVGRALVVASAFAVVAAACGSSSKSSSGGASTTKGGATTAAATTAAGGAATTAGGGASTTASATGGGTVRGITDTEIKVEGVAELQFYPGLDTGVKARFERENKAGGVNGRKLTFLGVQDDGSDAAKNLSITRSIVQKDGAFAVLPIASANFLPQSSDFLVQNKVPYYGWGFDPGFCGSSYGFGFNGCLISPKFLNTSLVEPITKASGKPANQLKIALIAGDNDAGRAGNVLYEALFKMQGSTVVYDQANVPQAGATTDYTPYVQAAIASNPDIIYVSTDFPSAIGISGGLNAAGFKGLQMAFVTYNPGLLQAQPDAAAALEGQYIDIQVPPQEEQTPAIKQFEADLQAIGQKPFVTLGASIGYWQADVFIQMLKAAGKDVTAEKISQMATSGSFSYTPALQGGVGAMKYPDALNQPTPCAALVQVQKANYVSKVPFSCYKVIPVSS